MTIEMAFNILMSIAAAAIGLSVRRLFSQLDEQAKTIIDMRLDYQTRTEARQYMDDLKQGLADIKADLNKLNDKLDKKADKP
ncbi:MAG TPA: hypothetical protein PK856_01030 [Vitreoscilla sp.]|mgnify:FL=1|jgi:hypothetical protein|nr:hypothetical protein [Vitreoscilla sp.]